MSNVLAMIHSGFNYWEPTKLQTSIADAFKQEIVPINAIQQKTAIEFVVVGSDSDGTYIDLANSHFIFRVQVQTAAGADPQADGEVSCIQSLAHSMFQRIEISANDKIISDTNALYPYRAYLTDLLMSSKAEQTSRMIEQGWYNRDVAGDMNNYRTTTDNRNAAATARNALIGTGQMLFLNMRPHLELFTSDKYIPPGIKIKIRFTPAPDNFVLKRGAGAVENRLIIHDAKFYCQYVTATHVQNLSIQEALNKTAFMRFHFDRVMMKYTTIATGSTTGSMENVYLGAIPKRIIVAMVAEAAMAGSLTANPFNFQHFTVNNMSLYVNGKMHPNPPYTPTWANGGYIREYAGALQGLCKNFSPEPVYLTPNEYANGYTFFVFDLTPDRNQASTISEQGNGVVRLLVRFGTALNAPVAVILMSEYDAHFDIDKFKNVTTNF